jgi:cytochrome b6-f complex iron-sulfur subunit
MDRKEFLTRIGLISVAVPCFGLASIMSGCKTPVYIAHSINDSKITVKISDFGNNRFVLVKNTRLPAPLYLSRISENNYTALLMLCTHKECELSPAGNILICPCHGSQFSDSGKVLSSPAQKDLRKYTVTIEEGNIIIQL